METTPFSTEASAPPPPPPVAPPPPPVILPPQPSKPRKSYGWMIVAIVLLVLLLFSVMGNISQFFRGMMRFPTAFKGTSYSYTRQGGPKLDEYLIEDHDASAKIAVVTVNGIITSHATDQAGNNMVDVIKAQLERAKKDSHVKSVILKVDSPGGEVRASDQIYRLIKKFQEGPSGKPVVCSMGSLAASGGYYISAPCQYIIADDLTITGSIGVIMHGWNYRGLMDKIGIAPNTYKSGKFKDMLSGERSTNEIPSEEHAMVQGLIMETYDKFKGVVREGRTIASQKNGSAGKALSSDWESLADGRVLSGTDAAAHGFVDKTGTFEDAVAKAKELGHVSGNANLIEYRERYDLSNFLQMFGESDSASKNIKLDLGLEMPHLEPGCMYFLSPTYVE